MLPTPSDMETSVVLRLGFNVSLLRSEENMFVSNPPEIATQYPEHIQRLCESGISQEPTCSVDSWFLEYKQPSY